MIAKNEEKNIKTALESVRDIAFEMIVVDTGSSDKTAEIAKEAGADVHYFEWINDFSAAKNHAMSKAKGDWVLVLDADEYLLPADAIRLKETLSEIEANDGSKRKIKALSSMIVNLDDDKKPMTKFSTVRVFRNTPDIRYTGRIHEQPAINPEDIQNADVIEIMHTGYSASAHKETGKGGRNLDLLREELKNKPNDINLKAYLANSLSMSADENQRAEAKKLCNEILENKESGNVHTVLKTKMYIFLINELTNDPEKLTEYEEMCRKALDAMPGAVDFEYLLAAALTKKGEYDEAWELLKQSEDKLVKGTNLKDSIMVTADPAVLFCQMIITPKEMGDIENVILYSTHVLTLDKTRKAVLGPCIATLLYYAVTEAETIELLSNIYDMKNKDEANFVAQTAREYGATAFAENIVRSL